MAIDQPAANNQHEYNNLDKIISEAAGEQLVAKQQMADADQARLDDLGAEEEARRAGMGDSAGMDLAMNIASEALGVRAAGDVLEIARDRSTSFKPTKGLQDKMGGFVTDAAQSIDDFTLGQRAKNASKALTGEIESTKEIEKPKTHHVEGMDSVEMIATREMVHRQKYEMAIQLQRQHAAEFSAGQPQAPGAGMGMAPSMGLASGPKGPSHVNNKPADDGGFDYAGSAGA